MEEEEEEEEEEFFAHALGRRCLRAAARARAARVPRARERCSPAADLCGSNDAAGAPLCPPTRGVERAGIEAPC